MVLITDLANLDRPLNNYFIRLIHYNRTHVLIKQSNFIAKAFCLLQYCNFKTKTSSAAEGSLCPQTPAFWI